MLALCSGSLTKPNPIHGGCGPCVQLDIYQHFTYTALLEPGLRASEIVLLGLLRGIIYVKHFVVSLCSGIKEICYFHEHRHHAEKAMGVASLSTMKHVDISHAQSICTRRHHGLGLHRDT